MIIDWAEIHEGDVLLLKGAAWMVTKIRDVNVDVQRSDGIFHSGPRPTGQVERLTHGRDSAAALIETELGGVEPEKDAHGRYLQPLDYDHPGALQSHMIIFHGGCTTATDLAQIRADHALQHKFKEADYVEHIHTP